VLAHVLRGSAWTIEGADFNGFDKTKQVAQVLAGINSSICLVVRPTDLAYRSSRNLGGVRLLSPERLNVRDIVESSELIFAQSALDDYKSFLELQNSPEEFEGENGDAGGEE
jgi:ribosomal protein L4